MLQGHVVCETCAAGMYAFGCTWPSDIVEHVSETLLSWLLQDAEAGGLRDRRRPRVANRRLTWRDLLSFGDVMTPLRRHFMHISRRVVFAAS